MGLSSWPDKFNKPEPREQKIVTAIIDGYVVRTSDKAVGIGEEIDGVVDYWLPLSQLDEKFDDSNLDQLIKSLKMPQWLADKNEFEYDDE